MSALRASVDVGLAGKRDQRNAEAFQQRQQQRDFAGFAGVGQRDHQILRRDHAEVAVAGFAGVHEKGRRAGARQRGGDLVADMAGFTHAGDDDAALALEHQIRRRRKTVDPALRPGRKRRPLRFEDGQAQLDECVFCHNQGYSDLCGGDLIIQI